MAQQLVFVGTNANDNTGSNLRAGGTAINANFTELYALQSQTISAGAVAYSGGATPEAKITLAITDAYNRGLPRVYIPDAMSPYNASLVTYNAAVQLVTEGGDWSTYNVKAYGAAGNNIQDDTLNIRAAITGVQAGTNRKLVFPHANYRITDTVSFAEWNDYFLPYEVDFSGSTITALGLTSLPALKFYNQQLFVAKNLRLVGNSAAGSSGIVVDSLQTNGTDVARFENFFITLFETGLNLASNTPSSNRVAFARFENFDVVSCTDAVLCNGLVDRVTFSTFNTSGCTNAGFHLTVAGALVFENVAAYGDYPLFLIDGAIGEVTVINSQNESPSTHVQDYFIKRTATGSGSGVARPMSIIGCTINGPMLFGAGSGAGDRQTTFVGCTISGAVTLSFSDYYLSFVNCVCEASGAITVSGSGSTVSGYSTHFGPVTCNGNSSQLLMYESTASSQTIAGNATPTHSVTGISASTIPQTLTTYGGGGRTTNAAYGTTVTPNAGVANDHLITPTDGVAFTIASPSGGVSGQPLRISIINTFGVLGAVTWGAQYKFAGGAQPAQPANGFNTTVTFYWTGSVWRESARAVGVTN